MNMKKKLFVIYFILLVMLTCFSMPQSAEATALDLSSLTSFGYINGALFSRFADSGSGTGSFDPFVRLQGKDKTTGLTRGYNTDGTIEFETKDNNKWTHSIKWSDVPQVNIGGTPYLEIVLDAAESGSEKNTLLLKTFEIYLLGSNDVTGYSGSFGTPLYDFGGGVIPGFAELLGVPPPVYDSILLDNITGQGKADMYAYIPLSLFQGQSNEYLYLYSEFDWSSGAFEEWGVKTGVIPEPTTISLLGLGLLGLLSRKRGAR